MKRFGKRVVPAGLAVLVIVVSFLSGVLYGVKQKPDIESITALSGKEDGASEVLETVDFSPFWRAWSVLDEKHVAAGEEEVSVQDRVWGAIQGLASSLNDPYTVFLPPSDAEIFESDISGNFSGVGMEIGMRNGVLTVIAPLKNTPAERAGVLTGDAIIEIDGESTAKLTIDKAVKLIRGERDTPVVLRVVREGKSAPFDIEIIRGNIEIPTIETSVSDEGVHIIKLFNFSAVSPRLFRESLREFAESGRDKLILDLRGNPGGFLEAAVDVASWFLPAGKIIARENFGAGKDERLHRSRGYDAFNDNLKFVILVNNGSASASEIVAGALSEHGEATLVGGKTFGKGSVQELVKITPETSLKVTIARWLTPNGKSISEDGLTPDVEVEITPEQLEAGEDPQLEKAIEILLSQ